MEYLLGTTLHRGGSWESTENHGPMVDDYGGGSAWCSRFATTALETILGPGVRAGSGYKVANPSEFADNLINYDTARGGAFVGTNRSRHQPEQARDRRQQPVRRSAGFTVGRCVGSGLHAHRRAGRDPVHDRSNPAAAG
ncbi:MAG TPA: hypothetical protein VIT65_21025 [Microlunatus sp.]